MSKEFARHEEGTSETILNELTVLLPASLRNNEECNTLPFPSEIREEILAEVLKSPREVSPWVRIWQLWMGQEKRYIQGIYAEGKPQCMLDVLRKGMIIHPDEIKQQFTAVCQISKQLRAEAIKVFFSRNSINFSIGGRSTRVFASPTDEVGREVRVNMPAVIERQWGREVLLGLRDLDLSVYTEYKDGRKTIRKEFRELVEILKGTKGLKRLVVNWSMKNFDWTKSDEAKKYDRIKCTHSCGRRPKSDLDEVGLSVWEEEEDVLEPLKTLKAIKEVVVSGAVSDPWARYLEECAKSWSDTIPEFHRDMYGPIITREARKEFQKKRVEERAGILSRNCCCP